jgi:AraC-like DNA-binding protein
MFVEQTFLSLPTVSGDRERHRRFVARFDKASKRLQGLVRTRTETIVRTLLPFAPCDLATTARMLGAAPRTLQRRLAAEDTSFDEIVDLVRADLALSYLKDSSLAVAEVAEILQFSETSALSRAFRRWHGVSPRQLMRKRPRYVGDTGRELA